jgi:HlyD family secretion protein
MQRNFLQLLTPLNVVIAVSALALIAVVATYAVNSERPSASYARAQMGNVSEQVSTTGTVKAADSLDLSFDVSGRVASIPAKVGTHVSAGQTLASLSAADVSANLAQAKANLSMQEAKLAGLKAGARPEDLAVSQTAVTGAQNNLTQAKQSVLSAAQDAYVKADDAVHNRADAVFDNPRSAQPHLNVTFTDNSLQNSVLTKRVQMETLLSQWQAYLASANANDPATLLSTTRTNLSQVSTFLDNLAAGLSSVTPSAYLTATTLQGYQSSIATARTNLSASLSALNAAGTAEQAAETGVSTAQSQYTLKQAGALPTDIQAQQAAVDAAEASVELASANLSKTVIRAPIAGIVARNDAHLGETAAPGVPLITINSDSQFQIEAYVSEADVSKITAGEKAQVHVDAYPDETFPATVLSIDPAATMQNGIASYKTVLQFDKNDPRIKAGLTANVSLMAADKENVLTVPTNAIITRGSDHYVLKKTGSSDALTKVQIGIEGKDGNTEILSGLSEGDMIRSFGEQ